MSGAKDRAKSLAWLAKLVNGKTFPFSPGLYTRPGFDANQDAIHEAMLELERRGQARLVRVDEDNDIYIWGPTD